MIAKYSGKCDLTGQPIVASVTEIERVGKMTVLAQYGTQEAIDAWYAEQVAKVAALAGEMATLRGRSNTMATDFAASFERRRADRMTSPVMLAQWVRGEVANAERLTERARA